MKKIIKGRKYDTTTATRVAGWSNGYSTNDLNYCSEDLYRKKTGEFFLYGEGWAMSIYNKSSGSSSWYGSSEIIPLTVEDAKLWFEERVNDAIEYEEIFGEVEK